MTDDADDPAGIDPAGDLANLLENRDHDIQLADDQDPAELWEFIERAESGEFGEIGPALEGQIRMVKAILDGE